MTDYDVLVTLAFIVAKRQPDGTIEMPGAVVLQEALSKAIMEAFKGLGGQVAIVSFDGTPVVITPPKPLYQVRLKVRLRVWDAPSSDSTKSATPLFIGHVHNVWESKAGWLRVDNGWIPDDPQYFVRV